MAKVPLPDRGQPLDVTYMYQMANAINDIADTVSTANNKYASIDTRVSGVQTFKVPDIRIVAGYIDVTQAQTVSQTTTIEKPVDFGATFQYAPIFICSIQNNNTQAAGNDATVVAANISTTGAAIRVRFATVGEATVGVNWIAIGVPR